MKKEINTIHKGLAVVAIIVITAWIWIFATNANQTLFNDAPEGYERNSSHAEGPENEAREGFDERNETNHIEGNDPESNEAPDTTDGPEGYEVNSTHPEGKENKNQK